METIGQEKRWATFTETERFGSESLEDVFFAKGVEEICLIGKYWMNRVGVEKKPVVWVLVLFFSTLSILYIIIFSWYLYSFCWKGGVVIKTSCCRALRPFIRKMIMCKVWPCKKQILSSHDFWRLKISLSPCSIVFSLEYCLKSKIVALNI